MKYPKSIRIVHRALVKFGENKGSLMGTALAYYALFSIAPILLIAITITGMFFGEATARDSAAQSLEQVMEPKAAEAIMDILEHSKKPINSVLGLIITSLVLFFGALKVFFHLRSSLCTIWELPPPRGSTLLGILVNYGFAVLMVLIVGLLLLTSVIASTFLAVALEFLRDKLPFLQDSFRYIEMGASLLFVILLFVATYRILAGRAIRWLHVIYGSVIAAFLFVLGKQLFSFYFAYANLSSIYGAGGSLVIFLIWVSYSAQVLILGAELIQARRTWEEWKDES